MSDSDAGRALREQLARWTDAGLIDAAQAGRIEAAELARAPEAPHRRLPLVAEVLGYVGAFIALVAAGIAVRQFWRTVPPGVELAFAAVAGTGLTVAGGMLRTGADPAFARLRGVLWLLATASATAFVAVLTHSFLRLSGSNVALLSEAAWLACAVPFFWRNRSSLAHLAVFAGAVALAETGLNRIDPGVHAWGVGLVLWVLSALWGSVVYRGYLVPRTIGLVAGGVGVLVGAGLTMEVAAGQALAVLTVAGLLALGIVSRRVLLIGIGAVGTAWVVPDTAGRYLPGLVVAPLAVAVVGLVLLGIALWLARTRKHA